MKQKQIPCTVRPVRRFFPVAFGLALGLLAVMASGCSVDDVPQHAPGGPQNALHVASAAFRSEDETQTKNATRAPIGYTALTAGSMGIFRSQGDGYTSALANKRYAYGAANGWQPFTAADTVFLNAGDAEVCAYYPYNAAYTGKTAIPLVPGKYTGTSAVHDAHDLCYAVNRTMNSYYRVTKFAMERAMALVDFVIRKDAGFTSNLAITAITLKNAALPASSTLDITSGTYGTPVKDSVTYNPGADASGLTVSTTAITSSVLLVPFTPDASGLTVTFTINGTQKKVNLPLSSVASLEAGKRYSIAITITPVSMLVTGVDRLPWDEVGVGGDGYTWYPEKERFVDIGLSFLIADGNLVGTSQPDGSIAYDIAEEQGWYSGASGGGDYWNWNELDPWNYTTVQLSWSDANDPCRKLSGGKWHTPTLAQLEELASALQFYGTWTKADKKTTVNGIYLGIGRQPSPAEQGDYLFLPPAGSRNNGGNMGYNSVGVYGNYWSSDAAMSGNASYLSFTTNSSVYVGSLTNRDTGHSIRCVREK